MSKIIFPLENKSWIQQNKGDLSPVLVATRNINLEKKGYITLSRRMSYLKLNGNLTVNIMAGVFTPLENNYRLITGGGRQLRVDSTLTSVTDVSDAGSFSSDTTSDIVFWNDLLWYSSDSSLKYATTGAFTSTATALNNGVPHPIAIFENKNILCVGNGNTIYSRSSAGVDTAIALTIPANFVIQSMRYLNNRMYIATRNKTGGNTFLFEWDGATALATAGYPVNSCWIMSLARYDESLVLITSRGELLRFGGGGFTQLATLPFFINKDIEMDTSLSYNLSVLSRGLVAIDDYLYIFFANNLFETSKYLNTPDFPQGIYQYHKDTGLVHRAGFSLSPQGSVTDFGQTSGETPSAIIPLVEKAIATGPDIAKGSRFMVGTRGYNGNFATQNVICSLTSGENRGSFVLCKIPTSEITGTSQKLYIKWRNMIDSTDKILVKYRIEEKYKLPFSAQAQRTTDLTWVNTTTFTLSSTNTDIAFASIGNEVEITSGTGSGSLAHITNITNVGTTYTITIDEVITGVVAGDRAGFIIDNWSRLGSVSYPNTDGYYEFPVELNSKWIQFKVELRGSNELQVEEIQIISKSSVQAQ